MIKKVFGIISYFPDRDTEYHAFVRKQRSNRCTELLLQLNKMFPDIDVMVIAQNWQDYKPPFNITVFDYSSKLGILTARKTLRQKFLESDYDYMIMLDDDAVLRCDNPAAYLHEIDNHPDGVGVIRHNNHPLQLLAISKSVYNQIPMADVDVEQGQGFEGDVFVAQCFTQFPEVAFDFTTNIKELSYKDFVLPSTWLSENHYDYFYLVNATLAKVHVVTHKKFETPVQDTKDIDIVIPYVDDSDPEWLSEYTQATGGNSGQTARFRSWGTLKYLLRGVAEYMPFIRDVILLVSGDSQIPDWLNQDTVRIVKHNEFIPQEYLPTFNSCTIEAYLFSITKLSDRFIYFNDDIFPISAMSASDFFTENQPHLQFTEHLTYRYKQIFSEQCRSSLDMVTHMLNIDNYPQGELLTPEHTAMPILKDTLNKVWDSCSDSIKASISAVREPQNINQYLYHFYQYYIGEYIDDICPYQYLELKDDLWHIQQTVLTPGGIKLLCLNDVSGNISDYEQTKSVLLNIFDTKFPTKCKYEL